LWEHWSVADQAERWSCTILTTQANATVRSVHGRMPVVLARAHHERWLDPAHDVTEELVALLSPCEESVLEAREVSTRVNDVSFDDAECIAPRPAPSLGPLFDSLR
jgi:putative SOS response-associated peptidase YedK